SGFQRRSDVHELVAATETDGRRVRVDVDDEGRNAERNAEPLALPDRETMDAGVRADHAASSVDDGPGSRPSGGTGPDECGVAAGRNEAKLLAFAQSEEHTSELQSLRHLVCRLLLEK